MPHKCISSQPVSNIIHRSSMFHYLKMIWLFKQVLLPKCFKNAFDSSMTTGQNMSFIRFSKNRWHIQTFRKHLNASIEPFHSLLPFLFCCEFSFIGKDTYRCISDWNGALFESYIFEHGYWTFFYTVYDLSEKKGIFCHQFHS